MAPNMMLLAFAPDITGLPAEIIAKSSRLLRLQDFIAETQSRRAEREVARYLHRSGRDAAPQARSS